MSRIEKNKLNFTVALIAEFAATYQIKQKQAFNYLNRFKGLVFLQKHYEVMHTQSFEDSMKLYQWYAVEMEDNCNEAIPWFKYGNRQAGPISFKALQRLWPRILSFSRL